MAYESITDIDMYFGAHTGGMFPEITDKMKEYDAIFFECVSTKETRRGIATACILNSFNEMPESWYEWTRGLGWITTGFIDSIKGTKQLLLPVDVTIDSISNVSKIYTAASPWHKRRQLVASLLRTKDIPQAALLSKEIVRDIYTEMFRRNTKVVADIEKYLQQESAAVFEKYNSRKIQKVMVVQGLLHGNAFRLVQKTFPNATVRYKTYNLKAPKQFYQLMGGVFDEPVKSGADITDAMLRRLVIWNLYAIDDQEPTYENYLKYTLEEKDPYDDIFADPDIDMLTWYETLRKLDSVQLDKEIDRLIADRLQSNDLPKINISSLRSLIDNPVPSKT